MQMQAGELFANRYRLIKEVGRGSFGDVWLVRDESLDLEMALKVYIALDERGVSEFKGEYKITYALNHSNLLKANYFDVYESHPYLAMPYCPVSTTELIGKMDELTAWRFVHDVAGGLAYLHSKSIFHRDIKPDNILRNEDGDFVITDFGISLKMRSTLRRNSTRKMDADIGGSFSYMAPELFSANPQAVAATDIWAFGVSLFELLVGELPFFGQGGGMLLRGAELPEVHGDFSDDLKSLVRSCLSKDTWERPTAEQLSDYAVKRQKGEPAAFRWDRQEPQREEEARKTVVLKEVGGSGYMNGLQDRPKEMEVREIRVGDVQFRMMPVAGGTFRMGADEKQGSWAAADEKPLHEVALSDYYIGQYPVTQGLWREVTGRNPGNNKAGDDYPVEYVSWKDCQEFIKKLNDRTGLAFRLPREAEWEYAARGGWQSRGFIYSGSDNADDVAWHEGNSSLGFWKGRRTHPVGQKKPNELGLYDMSGNVWEWCQDWYGEYTAETQTDPAGPASGRYRVFRGGSNWRVARGCRVSARSCCGPGHRDGSIGLRLVLSL